MGYKYYLYSLNVKNGNWICVSKYNSLEGIAKQLKISKLSAKNLYKGKANIIGRFFKIEYKLDRAKVAKSIA